MSRYVIVLLWSLILGSSTIWAFADEERPVKMKVVIDNDFCGDPDGLFQLVHQLMCRTCEVKAIIGGHLTDNAGFTENRDTQATESCEKANKILELMGLSGKIKVVPGTQKPMMSVNQPIVSEGAKVIVEEAMKCTPDHPLYVLCGASLSNIASAYLMNPEIESRIVLIWIGGQEYSDVGAYPPPGYSKVEYNLNLSIPAAQVIFNQSKISVWQVPRDVYRQCMYSLDEVRMKIKPCGQIGNYLSEELDRVVSFIEKYGIPMGEVYIMGDSPLVLLSALQSGFEPDPASSQYCYLQSPYINDDGTYGMNHNGRLIRVYTKVDTRLMFSDFEAKLFLNYNKINSLK